MLLATHHLPPRVIAKKIEMSFDESRAQIVPSVLKASRSRPRQAPFELILRKEHTTWFHLTQNRTPLKPRDVNNCSQIKGLEIDLVLSFHRAAIGYSFARMPCELRYARWPRVISLTVRHLRLVSSRRAASGSEYKPCKSHGNLELVHENLESKFNTLLAVILGREVSDKELTPEAVVDKPRDPKSVSFPRSSGKPPWPRP